MKIMEKQKQLFDNLSFIAPLYVIFRYAFF